MHSFIRDVMGLRMEKLICVGKNYLKHAQELGDAISEEVILFLKPPSICRFVNKIGDRIEVSLPKTRGSVHFECEIILKLNQELKPDAVSLGLDMTLRDVQSTLKQKGLPWEACKVFRDSAILGPWIPLHEFRDFMKEEFVFKLDGQIRQKSKGELMRHWPETCIDVAKSLFPLVEGDVLFTGTPEGVGPVNPSQVGRLEWRSQLLYEVEFI